MKLREEEFYEQYHHHGGTTIIPTEIFNELYDDATEEIERLEQGYCELKEKCNKGECDCTHEEYNGMCEENIKLDLEVERLNNDIKELLKENGNKEKVIKAQDNIIKEVREYINKISSEPNVFGHYAIDGDCKKWLLKILDKGNNNEDN